MNNKLMKTVLGSMLSFLLVTSVMIGSALGLDLDLVAEEATATMPDATSVTMWGLRDIADTSHTAGDWEIPVFTTSDAVLNINLTNNLPVDAGSTLAKPTSLIIPGLQASEVNAMVPTWTDGTTGPRGGDLTKRVRSLTREAANGGGSETYSWNLKPGTYLIQSGTHQAVQVQMGLFAVLVVYPSTLNQAYDNAATSFTTEQVLVYSEIDTALHAAVASDDYGVGKTYTSTMAFDPNYYLINGQPYSAGAPAVYAGNTADDVLLRFVNAGYETRVPVLQGGYFNLIAEDGNLLPFQQQLYSLELTAGKTKDAIWTSPRAGITNVYDGRFNLTSNGVGGGGLLTKLSIAPTGGVLTPNGGEILLGGTQFNVTWALYPGATSYRLFYREADNTLHWVANVGNVDNYDWTVPNVSADEIGLRFQVNAFNGGTRLNVDRSDGTFDIIVNTDLTQVLTPNGGETMTSGDVYNVTWTPAAGATVYKLFYRDADNTLHWVANVDGALTDYDWTVPAVVAPEAGKRFQVNAFNGGTRINIDRSDGTFTINPGP